ncbi:MerR family transcriptional regulator [Streptomyces dioscori]|uniref:MerR family transcriptional regulator n=1 Tax=Streptomyces dioscori TaxID=2109333 RepID=A0A2P8Q957_9ACTN|nr:MerR family transcriptional regulator [Streptomyces dioscori]
MEGVNDVDGTLSIGELAALARTTVKTVRFYSDRGLLPEASRSGGGHRRYGPGAPERLRMIRSLRSLGVPVPEIGRILDRGDTLEAVVARRLADLGSELTALRWREAALRAVHDGDPEQLAERLELIGAVGVPPSTSALAHYWRRVLPVRLSARMRGAVTEAAVPEPSADPTPDQVFAFARLHALATAATDHCLVSHRPATTAHPDLLYGGLHEAYLLVVAALRAGRAPGPGEALDCYVAAHARDSGTRDSPAFRRALTVRLAAADHPVMARYWQLAAELTPRPTLGGADSWLREALATGVAAA